jgi:GTP:adenosylcobinamide-phosphate guanylyltransferase
MAQQKRAIAIRLQRLDQIKSIIEKISIIKKDQAAAIEKKRESQQKSDQNTNEVSVFGSIRASCRDIQFFKRPSNISPMVLFNVNLPDISSDMFDFLIKMADSCSEKMAVPTGELSEAGEKAEVENIKSRFEYSKKQIEELKSMVTKYNDTLKEENAKNQAAQDKQQRLSACESTSEFKMFSTEAALIDDFAEKAEILSAISHDKEVEQMSGVIDLYQKRQNAESLLKVNSDIKDVWRLYKTLGGKASSPTKVKLVALNPCENLE